MIDTEQKQSAVYDAVIELAKPDENHELTD